MNSFLKFMGVVACVLFVSFICALVQDALSSPERREYGSYKVGKKFNELEKRIYALEAPK